MYKIIVSLNLLPASCSRNAAHGASQGGVTCSEESAFCPLQNAQAHRWSRLAGAGVIDRGERVCHSSYPESMADFTFGDIRPSTSRRTRFCCAIRELK